MKKIAVISIAIVVSLALSSLLSSCIVIPDQQTEPTPPPATEPEPTPEPEPAPEPEPNPDEPVETAPFEDIVWLLEAYGDRGSLEEPLEDTTITVEFQSDDGRVGGSAGCNSYSADYEIDGDELTIIPPINTTMMLCFPTSVMDQEHEYLELLESSETFTIEGDKLFISCADNKKLVFIEE